MSYLTFNQDSELQRYSLYAAAGRIYAQNAQSVLIDIGSVTLADDGFLYRVRGDATLSSRGFAGADDVLRDLSRHVDDAFLEAQFHALPDLSEDYSIDLNGASHLAVELARAAPGVAVALAAPLHRMAAPRAATQQRFAR